MKNGGILRATSFVFLIHLLCSFCSAVVITDVRISPENPAIDDIITVESKGSIPGGTLIFDEGVFTQDEFALRLDLYFTGGFGPQIPQPWFHNNEIGMLAQGNYDLSVQAYWRTGTADYVIHDTYSTGFEVVPEPATVLLLLSGAAAMKRKRSWKNRKGEHNERTCLCLADGSVCCGGCGQG